MLVLLGPKYSASEEELEVLVAETGLALYDLRTRLRPGAWSVVRAVADAAHAEEISARLRLHGMQCCALDSAVGQDSSRLIVYLCGIDVTSNQMVLRLAERAMTVPLGALLTIVRGDVHLGRMPLSVSMQMNSQSMRAAVLAPSLLASNSAPAEVFREQRAPSIQDVFVAADLHFITVAWLARIDARQCEFVGRSPDAANYAERLDRFIDELACSAKVRVDRHVKTSSLASHTAGSGRMVTPSPSGPASSRRSAAASDEHFDAYSRMVGEAERQTYTIR